jgi:dTDP-4-dehydrorhamnose reductase
MSKVLILGKNGQLAQVIAKTIAIKEKFQKNTYEFVSSLELDLTKEKDIENLFQNHPCDYCINTMAYTNVDNSETEEGSILNNQINNYALESLSLEASKNKIIFIHISSDYAINPINAYGKAKLEGEKRVLKNNPMSYVIRTSWLYSDCGKNFYLTMKKLTKEKETLNVIVDQIGVPTNAYDLADCLLLLCLNSKSKTNSLIKNLNEEERVFSFSNSGVTSWYDFACTINRLYNHHCSIVPISSSQYSTLAIRPLHSVLDYNSLINTFNLNRPKWWLDSISTLYYANRI